MQNSLFPGHRPLRLATETATTVATAIHTVDDGYRTEVHEINVCNNDGAPHALTIVVAGKSLLNGVIGAGQTVQWEGAQVMNSGEGIVLQADVDDMIDVLVSGSSGPAGAV